jgi:phosphoglycerate dehydrogenase-like enzyme
MVPHEISPSGPGTGGGTRPVPRPPVRVLVAAYHANPFWNLPPGVRARLEGAFPGVEFRHEPRWQEGFSDALDEAEVFFGWHLPAADFPRARRLRWIQSTATGVRRLLYPALRESEVILTSSRGVQAPFVAEHLAALLLAHERRIDRFLAAQHDRRWIGDSVLHDAPPESLAGRTLLIVGYGAIGRELARRLRPFGMRVVGVKRDPSSGGGDADAVHAPGDLDALLPDADVVAVLLPHTDETRGLFGEERFRAMKPGALFLSGGRGVTVDLAALERALASGTVAWAGLDVFPEEPLAPESPVWEIPRLWISPHVAGAARGVLWERLGDLFARNLRRYLDGEPLENVVDLERGY